MCMQCHGKLSHDDTKKAIKAALKLGMHVIKWVTFKNVSEMVFKTVLEPRTVSLI